MVTRWPGWKPCSGRPPRWPGTPALKPPGSTRPRSARSWPTATPAAAALRQLPSSRTPRPPKPTRNWQAALEALETARRLQQAAEAHTGQAQAEAAAARADADAAVTTARADAEAAIAAARAETGTCQQQARQAADDAAAARIRAQTEVTRARQAEADARAETERARADAARERDALHTAHTAQLQACHQLADLHRDRAERAEAALEAARHQPDRLAAQDTDPGRQPDPRRGRTRPGPPDGT